MHHSSIRDHLSKCHPDKSHNSCEPGYIFNSTAVPEPELSHFEPNTSNIHSSTLDMDDCKLNQKKLTNKMMTQLGGNGSSINTNNKRIKDESMHDLNNNSSQQFSQEDLTNNIKKFKQDYELNKLKNKKKMGGNHIKVNNKFRGTSFKDRTMSLSNNQQVNFDAQNNTNNNLDDSFQQTNEIYDQTYYSEDEHNTSIDETLNDNHHQNMCNKNSSPSASISSSLTSDSHISSNSIKNPNLQSLQFLASSMSANNNSNQQEQLFANLLSNLPNSQDTGPLNNIAAAVLQRLSTVALLQQFSNNGNNSGQNNGDFSRKSNDDVDGTQLDESGAKTLDTNQNKPKLHSGLDLSIKAPRKHNNKSCDNDTSDEYYSALSPVSTSSTNLSTSSLSSIAKAKGTNINNKSPSGSTEGNNSRKGILDVINRLKSQKVSNQMSSNDSADEMLLKSDSKSTCLDHDLSNNGLDELNDLIKSHLLPISEAVFDKYKSKVNGNGFIASGDECEDYEEHEDNFHEAPMENNSELNKEGLESTLPTLKKNCTFCNIFKNLIDLHELLHKT